MPVKSQARFTLPATPSLEHLKGQARALLRAFQDSEGEARERFAVQMPGRAETATFKLADAQFVVAREYGFPSWPGLKAYVEALPQHAPWQKAPSARQRLVREISARLLAVSSDPQALGREVARMPLRDILTVRQALSVSGQLAPIVDGLLSGLEDTRARVRFDCAGALDHFTDARCAELLQRLLRDPVPRVRRAALHSLSCAACKLNPLNTGPDFLSTLLELAQNDPSIRVRRAAVPMLESYTHIQRVSDLLNRLIGSDDALTSRVARQILGRQVQDQSSSLSYTDSD